MYSWCIDWFSLLISFKSCGFVSECKSPTTHTINKSQIKSNASTLLVPSCALRGEEYWRCQQRNQGQKKKKKKQGHTHVVSASGWTWDKARERRRTYIGYFITSFIKFLVCSVCFFTILLAECIVQIVVIEVVAVGGDNFQLLRASDKQLVFNIVQGFSVKGLRNFSELNFLLLLQLV